MKYRIGILEVTPAELAEAAIDGAGKWNAEFWIERIQMARNNAYKRMKSCGESLLMPFDDSLRDELAAIGVEMVED